jgi:hypothetical protein
MSTLEILDRDTWEGFLGSPVAVLVLAKTDCQHCKDWAAELEPYLAGGTAPAGVRFGKIYLDKPGLIAFKKAHPWIVEVNVLPFTAIFKGGEKVKTFAGGGLDRLTSRLAGVLGESTPGA